MNAVLVWKDGRREKTDCGGGTKIIICMQKHEQVTFELRDPDETEGAVFEYHETERRDATEDMREAGRRLDAMRAAAFREMFWHVDRDGDSWLTKLRRRLALWIRPRP